MWKWKTTRKALMTSNAVPEFTGGGVEKFKGEPCILLMAEVCSHILTPPVVFVGRVPFVLFSQKFVILNSVRRD